MSIGPNLLIHPQSQTATHTIEFFHTLIIALSQPPEIPANIPTPYTPLRIPSYPPTLAGNPDGLKN